MYNDSDDVMNRYRSAYETSLDPFKNFSKEVILFILIGKEASKRIKSMNPAERLVLTVTQLIVSHRVARWIFIGYLTSLHLLIFSSMYFLALSGHEATTATNQD
jgi:homeobox protein cut-like